MAGIAFQFTTQTLATLGATLLGLVIWWLVRKRFRRVVLPTVKILNLPNRKLPKLIFARPPLLLFMIFLGLTVLLIFFALRPLKPVTNPETAKKLKIHLFVDLSPSVSAFVNEKDLQQALIEIFQKVATKGVVTISNSHERGSFQISDESSLASHVENWHFATSGIKVAQVLSQQLEELGQVHWLVVISDRDQNSWSSFKWPVLAERMSVSFFDLTRGTNQRSNVYFNDISYQGNPNFSRQDWLVSLSRIDKQGMLKGQVSVTKQGTELTNSDFSFAEGVNHLELKMGWSSSKARNLADDNHLTWHIKIDQTQANYLTADDHFNTREYGSVKTALMAGGIRGEHYLSDQTYFAQKTLEMFGYRVTQQETAANEATFNQHYDLSALFFVGDLNDESNCPQRNWLVKETQKSDTFHDLWLIPVFDKSAFQSSCRCMSILLNANAQQTSVCADIYSRPSYIDHLSALGAKQWGGSVSDRNQAPVFVAQHEGLRLFAFTLPLFPRNGSLNHGEIPILIKQVLQFSNPQANEFPPKMNQWPRINDYDPYNNQSEVTQLLSNVPEEESKLKLMASKNLPEPFTGMLPRQETYSSLKQQDNDPSQIIIWGFIVLMILLICEAILEKILANKKSSATNLLLALVIFGYQYPRLSAQVVINEISAKGPRTYRSLSQEISDRTSINLLSTTKSFATFQISVLDEPWLAIDRLEQISDRSGKILPEVLLWLKRGGFLIVTRNYPVTDLQKFLTIPDVAGWKIIPPDHELMRSFYLLDYLPNCGNPWYGYHFDGRLAAVIIPIGLLDFLSDQSPPLPQCKPVLTRENLVRAFINSIMVALTTDYKKDQIHLPEILKRLR